LGENNIEGSLISPDLRKQPFAIEVSFISEKLEEDFEKALAAGAILERPVETKSWGQQVGYLRDINGFLVEIGSPIDH